MPVPPLTETLSAPPPPYPAPLTAPNPGLNTNSGLGQGPGLIILSPAGFVVRYNVVGWSTNGHGNISSPVVAPALGGISTSGTGDLPLAGYAVTGRSGVVDVVFTTGATGAGSQFVAGIVDQASPTGYIGIFLDNQNRLFCIVTDYQGTIVGSTEPLGVAVPAGQTLHATLEWNSVGAINGSDLVLFTVGETSDVNWSQEPSASWTAFQPTFLSVGVGFGAYLSFTGTIGNVQLGSGTSVPNPPQVGINEELALGITGQSTMTVSGSKVVHRGVVTAAGTSTVSATATTAGP